MDNFIAVWIVATIFFGGFALLNRIAIPIEIKEAEELRDKGKWGDDVLQNDMWPRQFYIIKLGWLKESKSITEFSLAYVFITIVLVLIERLM